MRLCIWQFGCVSLLLATVLSQAWAKEPEPQLVTDEFQETLARISVLTALKPPEILDFPPHKVRLVRLVIHETSGTAQPGIDEFEIFGPAGKDNLALAERGAVASASSLIAGYTIHKIEHLNDGKYGNDHSWIAAYNKSVWVQIELPQLANVARVIVTRDRTGRYRDRIPEVFEVLVSQDGRHWQSVARRDRTSSNRVRQLPYLPIERLPEKSWNGFLQYTFLRERATWSNIPADDHLSPLLVDRPAAPGGAPYWGRIARLAPLERVLVMFEEMIERLVEQGLDVTVERDQVADLWRLADVNSDSETLYLTARRAKRQLFFRDPAPAPLERILFAKRHPFLESHNYSEHLDGILEPGGGIYVLNIPRDEQGRFRPARAYGERAIFTTTGLRIYSAVEIGDFQEQLRTQTIDAKGHSTAETLNGALPRGRWNHMVITVDRRHEAQRVYVNGQDVTSTDHLGHRDWPARGPIWLGRFSDRENDRRLDLDGRLDDVRIYSGHLRQDAIRALLRSRKAH